MSEVVLLGDVVASYGSTWVRVANSRDLPTVQIHDRFREQGFGEGAEELEVEIIDLSPVSGASRIFFRRAANNTKAEVHRLGAVMLQTNPVPVNHFVTITNGSASQDGPAVPAGSKASNEGTTEPLDSSPKRGRGRPKGSKNRPRPPLQRVTVPAWPNV